MQQPNYLAPYLKAVERHGAGFHSLLWASPSTQQARFDCFMRLVNFAGKSVLDVGCGRADLQDHLHHRGVEPAEYLGLEAVDILADAAERKGHAVLRADFIREPQRLYTGSDVIVFSGSLNTLTVDDFYKTLRHAWQATAEYLVFNFLSTAALAAADFLKWHEPRTVLEFARGLSSNVHVQLADDYLPGDCTIALRKVE